MEKVMLLLFSFASLDKVIEDSFKLLTKENQLQVIAVLEEELPASLPKLISQIGFLGEKVTEDVKEIILKEYKKRGVETLKSISAKGREEGYQVKVEQIAKAALPNLKQDLQQREFSQLIINYTRDQFISKDVLAYEIDEFLEGLDIPYKIYYDGKLATQKQ